MPVSEYVGWQGYLLIREREIQAEQARAKASGGKSNNMQTMS
jgi:hypothetical protein